MFTFVSVDSSPRSYPFTYTAIRIPVHIARQSGINLSDMWRSTFKDRRGVAQLRAVKEIAPKSPFWCVNRSPLRYGFRVGARAVGYRVTIASVLLHSATRQLNFHFNQCGRVSRYVNHIVGCPVVRKTCNDVRTESIHGASRAWLRY